MAMHHYRDTERNVRIVSVFTLFFLACYGLVMVVAQLRPFWVDEWRIIYNLKYKSPATLMGPLDFMQQFPRVYLLIYKFFTGAFDYSYFTLRLPSFLVGTFSMIFCYRLMKRIYPGKNVNKFLFIMILVSSYTFTEYFVQVKQYTMDILLSLVAIWQLLEMQQVKKSTKGRYALLCTGFLVVPFFSYTYPISAAPLFIVALLQSVHLLKNESGKAVARDLARLWFPLVLCLLSSIVFYVIDVSQLMADKGMKEFWGPLMMNHGFKPELFVVNFYTLFAEVGSGLVFTTLFGIAGVLAFGFGIYKCRLFMKKQNLGTGELCVLYSVLLILIALALFVSGKLPLGNARLNTFAFPAIAMLLIYFLDHLATRVRTAKLSVMVSIVLYIGVIGNVYTSCYSAVSGAVYDKKMQIYVSTENAILFAQENNMPIFVTPGVAYPYDNTRNLPFGNTVPGDWVLKTFPAYKVANAIPVYPLGSLEELKKHLMKLPPHINAVLAGDGQSFKMVTR